MKGGNLRAFLWTGALALLLATAVHAGGIEDGEAGLAAFKNGDYDTAIRLFTRAIQVGKLSKDDSEFAYLNRGNAFVAKGDLDHAIADFKFALRLKPDDGDAKTALRAVLDQQSGQAQSSPQGQPGATAGVAGAPWGLLAAMEGKYFWYQELGKDPHSEYLHLSWIEPQVALGYSLRAKGDQPSVGEYKIDAKTGKIFYSALVAEAPQYGTVEISNSGLTEYTFVNNQPVRFVTQRQADGSLRRLRQVYLTGAWRDTADVQLVETTYDDLAAAGQVKPRKKK